MSIIWVPVEVYIRKVQVLKYDKRQVEITIDFLKVVRLVFWSGVVGPGTNRSLALRARTIALRAQKLDL